MSPNRELGHLLFIYLERFFLSRDRETETVGERDTETETGTEREKKEGGEIGENFRSVSVHFYKE